MTLFDPGDPLNQDFTDTIGDILRAALEPRRTGGPADVLVDTAEEYAGGGKRLRPAFCAWGYLAAAEPPADPGDLLRVAASLELLHASALVHDDIIDAAATRRGMAAAHVRLAQTHETNGWQGDPEAFGRAGAILLGNLLAAWASDLADSRLDALPGDPARARALLASTRTQVNTGQYLDAVAQAQDPRAARRDPDAAMRLATSVIELKTASYTVTRPLQLGAALAGGGEGLLDALADLGSPLGRAFQLRDDLLGVFGDSAVTGKPTGDDLREGKLTTLIVHAMEDATHANANRLAGLLGRPGLSEDEVAQARAIIRDSGAAARVEADIAAAKDTALRALAAAPVREDARRGLTSLVRLAIDRKA